MLSPDDTYLAISNLSHSIAYRHTNGQYRIFLRPHIFADLCGQLDEDVRDVLQSQILEEMLKTIVSQCQLKSVSEISDDSIILFWSAFGTERLHPKANTSKRVNAGKAFDSLLATSGLPSSVVNRALELSAEIDDFSPNLLPIYLQPGDTSPSALPLPPLQALQALACWKLGIKNELVSILQKWIFHVADNQSSWKLDTLEQSFYQSLDVEREDLTQTVLFQLLSRIAIYQPTSAVSLERWCHYVARQAAGMASRPLIERLKHVTKDVDVSDVLASGLPFASLSAPDELTTSLQTGLSFVATAPGRPTATASARISVLISSIELLLGVHITSSRELMSQLYDIFPSISDKQVKQVVEEWFRMVRSNAERIS